MVAITIYCEKESARLKYVLNWLFTEVLHVTYSVTNNENVVKDLPFFISYGSVKPNSFSIPDVGLLWESDIRKQDISIGKWKNIPTLYERLNDNTTLPFDLFSAIFFLLSRYEEYYSFQPDKYGRYPASESILDKNNWLLRPLVDEWIFEFYNLLKAHQVPVELTPFHFQPTYDIDMAYSYKHKGVRRSIGGFARSFLKGDLAAIIERKNVLLSKALDPFDSFVFIKKQHDVASLKPIYFVLAALKTTKYDKNISPENEEMQKLIVRLGKEGLIALHPSYFSNEEAVFHEEKIILEEILNENITRSRQHYLKFTLPETYRFLIDQHILHDYSMGYGTRCGFRAGTGRNFLWYDLKNETTTSLRVHPFCFMDTTAHFEEGFTKGAAENVLSILKKNLQKTSSKMITVFHNFSLGSAKEWEDWDVLYENFIATVAADYKKEERMQRV